MVVIYSKLFQYYIHLTIEEELHLSNILIESLQVYKCSYVNILFITYAHSYIVSLW